MEKIKVLEVGLSYKFGGIENFLISYFKKIDKNKFAVDFINVFEKTKEESFYNEMTSNFNVYNLPNYRIHPIKFIKELKKLNEKENYDIFHYNMNSACYLIPLVAAKICKIKVIIAHSHNSSNDKGVLKSFLHFVNKRFIPLFANTYFACSETAGKWFFSKKIRTSKDYYIINNAINVEKFKYNNKTRVSLRNKLGITNDTFVIGHVGRFKPQKNHLFLIDVFNEYLKSNKKSVLLLIGKGPLEHQVKEKVKKLGLNDNVIFLGQCSNVNEFYNAMDIFLLPSLYEGLPIVGVEASTNGLNCIFSNNITKEIDILKNIKFVNLEINEWVNSVIKIEKSAKNDRNDNYYKLLKSDYNIEIASKKLEDIYKNRLLKF